MGWLDKNNTVRVDLCFYLPTRISIEESAAVF
jgi:hypothetical protein